LARPGAVRKLPVPPATSLHRHMDAHFAVDAGLRPARVIVATETHAPTIDEGWAAVMVHPHVIGDFTWTGWDYLGEAGIGRIEYGGRQLSCRVGVPQACLTEIDGFARRCGARRTRACSVTSDGCGWTQRVATASRLPHPASPTVSGRGATSQRTRGPVVGSAPGEWPARPIHRYGSETRNAELAGRFPVPLTGERPRLSARPQSAPRSEGGTCDGPGYRDTGA
jgi:hypothetical protein